MITRQRTRLIKGYMIGAVCFIIYVALVFIGLTCIWAVLNMGFKHG